MQRERDCRVERFCRGRKIARLRESLGQRDCRVEKVCRGRESAGLRESLGG